MLRRKQEGLMCLAFPPQSLLPTLLLGGRYKHGQSPMQLASQFCEHRPSWMEQSTLSDLPPWPWWLSSPLNAKGARISAYYFQIASTAGNRINSFGRLWLRCTPPSHYIITWQLRMPVAHYQSFGFLGVTRQQTKQPHLVYNHVKHPGQRTAEYKHAFLLVFVQERRGTWDRYKPWPQLRSRVYVKIYCHWYKLALVCNLMTVLCVMSPLTRPLHSENAAVFAYRWTYLKTEAILFHPELTCPT